MKNAIIEEKKHKSCNLECKCSECEYSCICETETEIDSLQIIKLAEEMEKLKSEGKGKLKVCLIDGEFGVGKSYKLNKVLQMKKEASEKPNKFDYIIFDAFQTGFTDNFIFILFYELFKENKKNYILTELRDYMRKPTLDTWLNFLFLLVISIPLSLVMYKFLGYLVDIQSSFENLIIGVSGLLIFGVLTLLVALFLPFLLVVKKDYAVINRDFYYRITIKHLPQVLVIDDFERLTTDQRKQIYEFIDFCNSPSNLQNSSLQTIYILGNYELISKQETNDYRNLERPLKETFFDKYYHEKINVISANNAAMDIYLAENKNYQVNDIERKYVEQLVEGLSNNITRRTLDSFSKSKRTGENFCKELLTHLQERSKDISIPNYNTLENIHLEYTISEIIKNEIPINDCIVYVEESSNGHWNIQEGRKGLLQTLYKKLKGFANAKEFINAVEIIAIDESGDYNYEFFSSIQEYDKFASLKLDSTEKAIFRAILKDVWKFDLDELIAQALETNIKEQLIDLGYDEISEVDSLATSLIEILKDKEEFPEQLYLDNSKSIIMDAKSDDKSIVDCDDKSIVDCDDKLKAMARKEFDYFKNNQLELRIKEKFIYYIISINEKYFNIQHYEAIHDSFNNDELLEFTKVVESEAAITIESADLQALFKRRTTTTKDTYMKSAYIIERFELNDDLGDVNLTEIQALVLEYKNIEDADLFERALKINYSLVNYFWKKRFKTTIQPKQVIDFIESLSTFDEVDITYKNFIENEITNLTNEEINSLLLKTFKCQPMYARIDVSKQLEQSNKYILDNDINYKSCDFIARVYNSDFLKDRNHKVLVPEYIYEQCAKSIADANRENEQYNKHIYGDACK